MHKTQHGIAAARRSQAVGDRLDICGCYLPDSTDACACYAHDYPHDYPHQPAALSLVPCATTSRRRIVKVQGRPCKCTANGDGCLAGHNNTRGCPRDAPGHHGRVHIALYDATGKQHTAHCCSPLQGASLCVCNTGVRECSGNHSHASLPLLLPHPHPPGRGQ